MKTVLLSLAILLMANMLYAQTPNPKYDKALADSLGGGEMGMKMYVLAILKTGPTIVNDKAVRDSLFRGHMKNINRLAALKKLIVAGPLEKNDRTYRGIFILDVPTIEEAKTLVVTDPAVAAGVFDVEYFNWFGSAALRMYIPYDEKLHKNL